MTKRQFQALLDHSGSSLMRSAEDLGLAESTVSRWGQVPGYAQWYAVARSIMTAAQREIIDTRFRRRRRRPPESSGVCRLCGWPREDGHDPLCPLAPWPPTDEDE